MFSLMCVLVAISKAMQAVKLCSTKIIPVFNWECQLMQVFLYNGRKMVVVVAAAAAVIQLFFLRLQCFYAVGWTSQRTCNP